MLRATIVVKPASTTAHFISGGTLISGLILMTRAYDNVTGTQALENSLLSPTMF